LFHAIKQGFILKYPLGGYYGKHNSFNESKLCQSISHQCEKVCEVAHFDMGGKAVSGSAKHKPISSAEAVKSPVDSVKNDLRLSLIVDHWDIIPESVRQSVFLQLAQFSFEKWREKS
jgi:hypothetical protein